MFGGLSEKERDFLTALGRAISEWQTVEHCLYRVFEQLLKCPDERVTSLVFHYTEDFETKVTMVDKIAHVILSSDLLKEWKTIHRDIPKYQRIRNHLAHLHKFQSPPTNEESSHYFLGLSPLDAKSLLKYKGKTRPHYTTEQIWDHSISFNQLGAQLIQFAWKLASSNDGSGESGLAGS